MAPRLSKGICPDELSALVDELAVFLAPAPGRPRPWCAGAVVLAGRGGEVLAHQATGWALRYAAYDAELPPARRVPMRVDTVFDLASLTKLFTAAVADAAGLAPHEPVVAHVPEFGAAGKRGITVGQLLDHTSGLRPELPFHDCPDAASRAALLWAEAPVAEPGTTRVYSDLNLIALQHVLERATGEGLDALVREHLTDPLGMYDTRFAPPSSWVPRIAATEDQRRPWGRLDRGLLRGVVHDENAFAMGGVAGHAGLFSTAWDLALFCRAMLDRGGPFGRWLGFERDQAWFMGELAGRGAVGHTGFTGTSVVLDPATDSFLVLLANSVHPCRTWREGSAPRAALGTRFARALAGPRKAQVGQNY